MPKPPTAPRAYPESAPGGWTIEKVRTAILDLEQGFLARAARLTRALSRDPRYVQGREQFVGAVQGCQLDVVPAPIAYGGVGTARRLAEEGADVVAGVMSDGAERWMIEWGKACNLAVGVLGWDTSVRPWRPISLTRWPLEAVRVDMTERRLYARLDTGREVEIVPGDGTWVAWTPGGWLNWDAALVRVWGDAMVSRWMASRDLGNRTQAASVAAIDAGLPAGVGTTDPDAVAYEEKIKALQTGSSAGILRPADYPPLATVDLLGKGSPDLFKASLDTRTKDLLVPWLMQDGTATNEGGSLAKVQTLDGVMMSAASTCVDSLWGAERVDGSHVPGAISAQILRPWALLQGADPRLAPLALRRVPDLEEDARLEAQATRAEAWRLEVKELRALGYEVGEKEARDLAEARGVRLPDGLKLGEPAPVPPPVLDPAAEPPAEPPPS